MKCITFVQSMVPVMNQGNKQLVSHKPLVHSFLIPSTARALQGVDFFFNNRAHALKFISFVQSVVPAKYRSDKQLVSHNEHTATYNYKYTFSVEIVPICRVSLADPSHLCFTLSGCFYVSQLLCACVVHAPHSSTASCGRKADLSQST